MASKIKIFLLYLLSFVGFYLGFGRVDIFPTINPFLIMFLYVLGSQRLISRIKEGL
jgi:hypothetical protein